MKYCAIASGSNGNCYYIAKDDTAILIDAGINSKHIHLRMANLGILPTLVKAIFITHEHSDHVKGLSVFAKKYNLPVYITEGSYRAARLHLPSSQLHFIAADAVTPIGTLTVTGIPKYHDAKEPCSFRVSDGIHTIAVLTDIGRGCSNVQQAIAEADVLLLESNYDEALLQNGRYPYILKQRISGGLGHISNAVALDLFNTHRSSRLKHLVLTHLSGENNTVELVAETFTPYCQSIQLSVATRYQETPLFSLSQVI